MRGFVAQADAWGAEIIAQVPVAEAQKIYASSGVTREAGALYEQWPQYYYWEQRVLLLPSQARSPKQLADELDVWLPQHGWVRNTAKEFPPTDESFTRDYYRDGDSLSVEAYTVPLPRAQLIAFRIVTPQTGADSR